MIERLEDETRALASCRRTKRRLAAIVEDEKRKRAPGWLKILSQDADGLAEDAGLLRDAKLLREAQLARDAELKEAVARLDGIERDLRDWSGRLVPELGLAIRMFGRVIRSRPLCRLVLRSKAPGLRSRGCFGGVGTSQSSACGLPEPAEVRRLIEELTEEVKHASCARELSAEGGDFTRQVRERATGPPGRAGGIP